MAQIPQIHCFRQDSVDFLGKKKTKQNVSVFAAKANALKAIWRDCKYNFHYLRLFCWGRGPYGVPHTSIPEVLLLFGLILLEEDNGLWKQRSLKVFHLL